MSGAASNVAFVFPTTNGWLLAACNAASVWPIARELFMECGLEGTSRRMLRLINIDAAGTRLVVCN